MNILARTNKINLAAQLANKGAALRTEQSREAEASKNFIEAAKDAQSASDTASRHAAAVEQAVQILEEAGVVL